MAELIKDSGRWHWMKKMLEAGHGNTPIQFQAYKQKHFCRTANICKLKQQKATDYHKMTLDRQNKWRYGVGGNTYKYAMYVKDFASAAFWTPLPVYKSLDFKDTALGPLIEIFHIYHLDAETQSADQRPCSHSVPQDDLRDGWGGRGVNRS